MSRVIVINANRLLRKIQAKIARQTKDAKGSVVIGYTAPYAIFVHENLTAYHKPPTQAKFLEAPALQMKPTLRHTIYSMMRSGRTTLMQVLLKLGYKLLGESKKIVPVDTGFLKSSGFVRME